MKEKTRIFALDYGRGTMAGYYSDYGVRIVDPKRIMDAEGETSGFARLQDGTYLVGSALYAMGAKQFRNVAALHLNVKELPNGDDALQVECAKAWRERIVRDNATLFQDGHEERWIIGCPTGWRSQKTIEKYRAIFEKAGFPNVIIVPESNAAMLYAENTYDCVSNMDKDLGALCLDLGAYSADATYVQPGKVSSYGGFVGASLVERMILSLNLRGGYCPDTRNTPDLVEAVRTRVTTDDKFRAYLLLQAKSLKESYYSDIVRGKDYSDLDCCVSVDLRFGDPTFDALGARFFELRANDAMMRAVIDELTVEEALGDEFGTLAPEVRAELVGKTWRAALGAFFETSLQLCPEFAEAARKPGPRKPVVILTGGASLMPFASETLLGVMPNANVYTDHSPMTSIAKGLLLFGPDKLRALAFTAEFRRILTENQSGESVLGTDRASENVFNVIASRAHDKLGLPTLERFARRYIDQMNDSVDAWSNHHIDSDYIVERVRNNHRLWRDGDMPGEFRSDVKAAKTYLAEEINKVFDPLLKAYGMSGTMVCPEGIDLEYADNLLKYMEIYAKVIDKAFDEDDAFYRKLPNPGPITGFFRTSRAQYMAANAPSIHNRINEIGEALYLSLKNDYDGPDVYRPFLRNCLLAIFVSLESSLKTRLGELIVEETFDDED